MPLHPATVFQEALTLRRARQSSIPETCAEALKRCKIEMLPSSREWQVFESLASWVEESGKSKAEKQGEHPYHNRQHIADALTALSFFLEADEDLAPQEKILCLIAMLLHDFGHEGAKANKENVNLISQEQRSIDLLNHPSLADLDATQLQMIKDWILGTEFSAVNAMHAAYLRKPTDHFLRMQAYINEADIAASLSFPLGFPLTRLFILERDSEEPTFLAMQETLQKFHRECLISTPIAKHYLNRE